MVVRTVARNTFFLSVGKTAAMAFSFLLIIFVARQLGVEQFGIYGLAFSFTAIFAVILDLGLESLIVREVARDKKIASGLLSSVLLLKCIFLFFVAFLLVSASFAMGFSQQVFLIVLVVGMGAFFNSFTVSVNSFFQAFQRMEFEAYSTIFLNIAYFCLGILALFFGFGLLGLVLAFLAANICAFLLSFFFLVSNFGLKLQAPSFPSARQLFLFSLPFIGMGILNSVYSQLNVVILSAIDGEKSVAFFSSAYRIVIAFVFLKSNFIAALYPVLSEISHSKKSLTEAIFKRTLKYLLIVSVPVSVLFFFLSEKLVQLIYGQQYASAALDFATQGFIVPLLFVSSLLIYLLLSLDKQRQVMAAFFFAAAASIPLNIFLIKSLSHFGASLAAVFVNFLLMVLLFFAASRKVSVSGTLVTLSKPVVSSAAAALAVLAIPLNWVVLQAALFFAIYAVFLFLLRSFDETDAKIVSMVFSRKKISLQGIGGRFS